MSMYIYHYYIICLGDTALINSVREKSPVFDILLNTGADITVQNPENGRTVLHVAVAYNRQTMLKKCVQHPCATITFAEVEDVQGETALMIAVKLRKIESIRILTAAFRNLNGINLLERESVLHIAIYYDRLDILKHLLQTISSATLHFQDSLYRTPVHYAAELDHQICFKELIECGADFYEKNPETGETILHVVAKHNSNTTLPFILSLPLVSWFFLQKDFEGNTPYMSAIKSGNDNFLRETFKLKKIDLCDYNTDGETPTYYTVKQGFPNILRTLLLSPKYYDFAKRKQNEIDLEDPKEILKAEIRGDIYATDVYILLKKIVRQPLTHWFPPNLLMKTKKSRSVFHACALSANLECLEFLYDFFKQFAPKYLEDVFDKPGVLGNTPLLLAAQCEPVAIPCVEFFIKRGADLSAVNRKGLNVTQAIIVNSPDEVYLFKSLFNGCVLAKKEQYNSDRMNIRLDFSILCPKKEAQTAVTSLLFNEVLGEDRRKILEHPVIVVFLKEKIRKVITLFYLHFLCLCVTAILVSILVPLLYIQVHDESNGLFLLTLRGSQFIVVSFVIFNGVLKIPLVINKEIWFTDVFSFITPVSIVTLILFGKSFYFAPEIGAIAILSSWIMALLFSVNLFSSFSYQISVFFRLLNNISKHLIVLTVVLFAFALSFSCLYHREERFSHFPTSFIYTSTVMLPGFLSDLPTFKEEYFTSTSDKFHFSIECFIITVFILVAITAFVNMLVGLAVQGGRHLEVDGKIFKTHHETHYLNNLEFLFKSKFYFWLVKIPMFKFIRGWKQKLHISMTLDIYGKDNQHNNCDDNMIRQLRKIVYQKAKPNIWEGVEHFGSENFEDVFNDPFGHLPGAKDRSNSPYEKKSIMKFRKSEPLLLTQPLVS